MTNPIEHISISINRKPSDVYAFASNGQNLPKWAGGLSGATIRREGDFWICTSPMGEVKVKFAQVNSMGVMDHEVTLPDGEVNYNAFRTIPNADGSEVIFSLSRLPKMSDKDFVADREHIVNDLAKLKKILES